MRLWTPLAPADNTSSYMVTIARIDMIQVVGKIFVGVVFKQKSKFFSIILVDLRYGNNKDRGLHILRSQKICSK